MQLLKTISKAVHRLAGQGVPLFDATFIAEISRVGFHPFIMDRTSVDDDERTQLLVCATQNDAGNFAKELSTLPEFAESRLIQGLEKALQLEIYDAADLLYSWIGGKNESVDESIHLGDSTSIDHPAFFGYPAFGFGNGAERVPIRQRRTLVLAAFHTYYQTKGNDALRFAIMEAMALSLSRSFGSTGQYKQAADVINKALENSSASIHLKAARHAL